MVSTLVNLYWALHAVRACTITFTHLLSARVSSIGALLCSPHHCHPPYAVESWCPAAVKGVSIIDALCYCSTKASVWVAPCGTAQSTCIIRASTWVVPCCTYSTTTLLASLKSICEKNLKGLK
jgi:hypothetical protein